MQMRCLIPGPDLWLHQIFAAKAAQTGGVVRRKRTDVDRRIGWTRLLAEVDRRGFHVIETGDQVLIICNNGHFRVIR